MNTIDKKYFRNSVYATYIASVMQIGFSLAVSFLLIKYLSKEEYGSYHIILSINTLVVYLTSFGLASVFARFIPEFLQNNFSKGLIKLSIGGVFIRMVGVVLCVFLIYLFKNNISELFSLTPFLIDNYSSVLLFVFFSKIDETLGPMILGAYIEHVKLSSVQILQSLARLCIIVVSLYYFHSGLKGILYGFVCLEIFISIIYCVLAVYVTQKNIKNLNENGKINENSFPLKRIYRYGGYSFLLASTGVFRDVMIDNFVISHFLGVHSVAYYGFCYTIINMVTRFNPVQLLKIHISHWVIREYVANRNLNVFTQCHRITTSISFVFLAPLLSFTAIFTDEIIMLLNKDYLDVRNLVILMFLIVAGNALQFSYSFVIDALEMVQYRFYANIFSLYNLVADIILIQFFGIHGIILATGSASILTAIYYHYIVKSKIDVKISYNYYGILKIIMNVIGALIIVTLIQLFITKSIFVLFPIFILSYLLLLLKTNPFDKKEWEFLMNITGLKSMFKKSGDLI